MEILIENANKIKVFQNAIQVISLINDISSVQLTKDGLCIKEMDTSHICLFELVLDSEWFDDYRLKSDQVIGINLKNLVKILSCLQDGQRLHLSKKTVSDQLLIDFLDKNTSKKKPVMQFEINLIEREFEPLDTSRLDYTNSDNLVMASNKFESLISLVGSFGDTISIKYGGDSFTYSSEGNFNESKIKNAVLDLDNDVDDYTNEDEIELSLAINYLAKITKASKVGGDMMLYIKEDAPVCFKYMIGTDCHLTYWLPPKIPDNED